MHSLGPPKDPLSRTLFGLYSVGQFTAAFIETPLLPMWTSYQHLARQTTCEPYATCTSYPNLMPPKTSRTIWSNFTLLCSFYKNFILNFRALTFALFRAFAEVVGEMGEVLCSSREFSEVLWGSLRFSEILWSSVDLSLSKFCRSLQSLKPSKVLEKF